MDYIEFRRNLGKAGLTIKAFADLIKINRNSLTNCSKIGKVPDHIAIISVLLGEMAEHEIDFRKILSGIKIDTKKSRGSGFKPKAHVITHTNQN